MLIMVAIGAALWGTDPLFRRGLALSMPTPAIVFAEHLLPVVLVSPYVLRGLRRARRVFAWRDWLALFVIGCGSSALATILFTEAFTYGSPTTPVLLQQIQPLFAVAAATVLLRERLRPMFGCYLAAALCGAYLIAFPDPGHVPSPVLTPALLALAAAVLWGLGTVLGRHLTAKVPFVELTALRLVFGLVAVTAVAGPRGDLTALVHMDLKAAGTLVLLALFPGLFSLLIYYRGLRGTPAAAATLGELAFPATTLLIGYLVFQDGQTLTQWIGIGLVAATVLVMGTTRPGGTPTAVEPTPATTAAGSG